MYLYIFWFENISKLKIEIEKKLKKLPISQLLGHKKKKKLRTLCFLKLENRRKESVLSFLFKAQEPKYEHFFF